VIDVETPGSAGFLLNRLTRDLFDTKRLARLEMLDAWYRGDPPLPLAYAAARDAVRAFHRNTRSNFAALLSEAPRERLRAEGIQTSSDGDATGDDEAWRIYRRARMALAMAEVHRLTFRFGLGFALVSPVDPSTGVPVVTAEDPRWVVSEQDPLQPWRTVAGLKVFRDSLAGRDYAYLFRPGRLDVAFREVKGRRQGDPARFSPASWDWDEELSRDLPAGLMPLIRFANLDEQAEFEPHLDLLGRINYMVLQRMTIATLQAFKQRAVKGVPAVDPKTNERIDYNDIFTADPGAIWALPETAEMWESQAVDLSGILASVKSDIQALAAVSRTPLSMFAPEGENQSAEGAASAKEGLIFKVEDRIDRLSPCWSAVMQACFLLLAEAAADDADREAALKRADLNGIDIIWAPAARASLSERASALAQAAAAGVPFRSRMIEFGGFTPERVNGMETERVEDAVFLQQQAMAQARATAAAAPAPAPQQAAQQSDRPEPADANA
jgi:hypothetical protein